MIEYIKSLFFQKKPFPENGFILVFLNTNTGTRRFYYAEISSRIFRETSDLYFKVKNLIKIKDSSYSLLDLSVAIFNVYR